MKRHVSELLPCAFGDVPPCECFIHPSAAYASVDRRSFVRKMVVGASLIAWKVARDVVAGPFDAVHTIDHFVPDHFARAMASSEMISRFEYQGPRGEIGFAPRLTPEDFKPVFAAAGGRGNYAQHANDRMLYAKNEAAYGNLKAAALNFQLSPGVKLHDHDTRRRPRGPGLLRAGRPPRDAATGSGRDRPSRRRPGG